MKREVPSMLTTFKITNDSAEDKPSSLIDLEKDIREFLRAVQSGTQDKDYLKTRVKDIDNRETVNGVANPSYGRAEAEIVTRVKNANLIEEILNQKNSDIDTRNSYYNKNNGETPYQITRQDTEVKSGFMTMHGSRAQKEAIMAARANNGDAWLAPTKNNPDRMQYYYPYQDLSTADPNDARKRHNEIFKYARQESNYVGGQRKAKEQEKAEIEAQKEEERRQKEEEKRERELEIRKEKQRKRERQEQKERIRQAKENLKEQQLEQRERQREQRAEQKEKQKQQERKAREQQQAQRLQQRQRQQSENAEAQQQQKELKEKDKQNAIHKRMVLNVLSAVVSLASSILSVCRKILTSMLNSAVRASTDRVDASTVRITAARKRELDNFDTAHNLKEGSSFEAIRTTQSLFGNIENPNQNAMGIFAPLLKGKLGDYVRMGMGKDKPEELTRILLDTMFNAYKQGINHLGRDVGSRDAAFSDINTALMRVAPEYATVFSRLVEDYNSGNYGKFDTVDEWYKTTSSNYATGKVTEDDTRNIARVGEQWKSLLSRLDRIYEVLMKILTDPLGRLLSWLDQSTAGMTSVEIISRDRQYLEKSLDYKAKNEERERNYNKLAKNDVRDFVLNTSHIKGVPTVMADMDFSDIVGIGSGNITDDEISKNADKYKAFGLKSKSKKDIKKFREETKNLYEDMQKDSRFADLLPTMLYTQQNLSMFRKDKYLEEQYIGTGKIKDYSRTESQEATDLKNIYLQMQGFTNQKKIVTSKVKDVSDYDREVEEVQKKASEGVTKMMENDPSFAQAVAHVMLGDDNGYLNEHPHSKEDLKGLFLQMLPHLVSGMAGGNAVLLSTGNPALGFMMGAKSMQEVGKIIAKNPSSEQTRFLEYFDKNFEQNEFLKKKYGTSVNYFKALFQEKLDSLMKGREDYEKATTVVPEDFANDRNAYVQNELSQEQKRLTNKYSSKEGKAELIENGQYKDRVESYKYQIQQKKLEGAESRAENYRNTREKEKEFELLRKTNPMVWSRYSALTSQAEFNYGMSMRNPNLTSAQMSKLKRNLEEARKKAREAIMKEYKENPDDFMPDSLRAELAMENSRLGAKYSTAGLLLTPEQEKKAKENEAKEKAESEKKIREKHAKQLEKKVKAESDKYDAETNDYINANIMKDVYDVSFDELYALFGDEIDAIVDEHIAKALKAAEKQSEEFWDNNKNIPELTEKIKQMKDLEYYNQNITPEIIQQAMKDFMTNTPQVTIPLFFSEMGVETNRAKNLFNSEVLDPYMADSKNGMTDDYAQLRTMDMVSRLGLGVGNYTITGKGDEEHNTYTLIIKDDKGKIMGVEQMNGRTGSDRKGTLNIGEVGMELQMSR